MKKDYTGQIIVGIIITVVGGVILAWIVGDGRFSETTPNTSAVNNVISTPNDSQASTNIQISSVENSPVATSTPWGIKNPTSPVLQGERALVGDYAIWVSGLTLQRDTMWFDVYIENIDTQSHVVRFTKISFTLEDDAGNKYLSYFEDDSRMYEISQLSIDSGEVAHIKGTNLFWSSPTSLPHFLGPISSQASKLIVVIKGDSPFNGLEFELDL